MIIAAAAAAVVVDVLPIQFAHAVDNFSFLFFVLDVSRRAQSFQKLPIQKPVYRAAHGHQCLSAQLHKENGKSNKRIHSNASIAPTRSKRV